MARSKLTLFVDIISPFAHMAFYVITTNPLFKQCDLEFIPMFLGGVMQSTGNRPPMSIQNKGVYLNKQRDRFVKKFNIPMADTFPEPFPQPTIVAGRALCVVKKNHPAKLVDACTALYKAFFIDLKAISKPETVIEALSTVFGTDEVKQIMELSNQPEFKKQLIANTDLALEKGCFGLPYYVAVNPAGQEETFWGFDHLGQVVEHLQLGKQGEEFRAML